MGRPGLCGRRRCCVALSFSERFTGLSEVVTANDALSNQAREEGGWNPTRKITSARVLLATNRVEPGITDQPPPHDAQNEGVSLAACGTPSHDAKPKPHGSNNFDDHRAQTARAKFKNRQPLNHFAAKAARKFFDNSNRSHADEGFSPAPDRTAPEWKPCQTLYQLSKTLGGEFWTFGHFPQKSPKNAPGR
jgi:hypothetical protein